MANDGKALERLVALIESALGTDGVKVETRKRLPDRITGNLREHDVLVTITRRHHELRVAIECKDTSRPVTVQTVEAFHQKCRDTGIDQGAIVATSGFAGSAREKAAHYNIRCLDILSAESFSWMLGTTFTFLTRRLDAHSWKFFPEVEGIATKENMEILLGDGSVAPPKVWTQMALAVMNNWVDQHPEPVERHSIRVKVDAPDIQIRNPVTDARTAVRYAIVSLTYSVIREDVPFELSQYVDGKNRITDVAIADGPIGRVAFVYDEAEGGSVIFQASPKMKPG